ncbi:Lethal(3)malignant brain tumor-like protein 3 [Orchesella cincta]|uniref:Lethal(3)malignant brain tumor-like protein 3 n=1 Tax=Orchesella cincta TaxID=48709 RepID=A0A1D2ME32_ORCCI|nr:Lethal(3)malignant brain tumor-like protein 3 [Orchesella cincta]
MRLENMQNVFPFVPQHNNNQPFNGVELAITDYNIGDDEQATIYSLVDPDEEGISVEPDQNLKFITNEYGFMELLDDDDTDEDSSGCSEDDDDFDEDDEDEPPEAIEIRPEPENQDIAYLSCVVCGCFGVGKEFYDSKHCTYDCGLITRINECKRLREEEEEEENEIKKLKIEEENRAQEISVKVEVKQEVVDVPAPPCLFRSGVPVQGNPFKVHDLLEAIDPEHQSLFCPVQVVEIIGFRLLLKFIGYSDKYNFWVNADSRNIFPVRWSQAYGSRPENVSSSKVHFHGPPGFSWDSYIPTAPESRVAPHCNFPNLLHILSCKDTGVRVGMKLEAVDIRNRNLVCVATVSCVMGDRFLIHFDSWDSLYDYWTDCGSPFIHPVGWCSANNVDITPPHCYESPSEFDWDEYLEKTNSVALPKHAFKPATPAGFKLGHQIEVVDKRSPRLLRRATIAGVDKHVLTVHFDALDSEVYDYSVDEDCPDIHVVGWGESTGHPVADEYEVDDLENENAFPVCPNHKVCRSVCSAKGPSVPFHSKVKDCPFSKHRLSESSNFTDRVVVFEDKYYDIGGVENNVGEVEKHVPNENARVSVPKRIEPRVNAHSLPPPVAQNPRSASYSTNSIISSKVHQITAQPLHQQNHQAIPKRTDMVTWSHERVSTLVQGLCANLPTAGKVAEQFRNNLIDGESFLMLTQSDMTDALGIKLGPAVKIYNLIRLIDLNK